ncbi:MAG: Putrescine-binding periplasmic protein SpuD [Chlamydiae bacterium]|nr:Putrescine-binding periplasmic protein SpuD [Chlamydiota bacterium]
MKPIRLLMVIFWVLLIFGALYLPNLKWIARREESINVFCWGDVIDPDVVADFQRETGIKVHLNYYSSNDELIVKMKATRGYGYDLIAPSDFAVAKLVKFDLLKRLDRSKLTFWNELNPLLLGHSFDPNNAYSVPFEWEVFGLGYDLEFFKERPFSPSWEMLFKPQGYQVAMLNNPGDSVLISSLYLFGKSDLLTQAEFEKVRQLLLKQKPYVEAYADFRTSYFLATKNCPVVVTSTPYIWRLKRTFPFLKFAIPKEGTYISIENFALPLESEKEELVYTFLNYLYTKQSLERHFETFGNFPAILRAVKKLEEDPDAQAILFTTKEEFKKFHLFQELVPQKELIPLWVELKSY